MIKAFVNVLKNASFPAWLLSFYVFIWFMQIGNRVPALGAIRIEFLTGVVLILLSVVAWVGQERKSSSYHSPLVWSILTLYGFLFVYTVFSYDSETSWAIFIDRVVKFSMMALFISMLIKNKYDLMLVLMGFMVAMLKITQEGVWGVITGGMIWENQGIPRLHGVTMMYRHPNSLSGLAVGALPFFLFLLRFQLGMVKVVFAGAILGLLMVVMYTGSRTGYVATIILFLAIIIRVGLFKPKVILLLLSCLLLSAILIPEEYKGRFSTIFKSEEERGSSANKRIEILNDAWAIAKKYPMGIGVQAFPYVRDLEFGRQQDTHNLYLEVLTNIGPFGAITFAIFIVLIFKTNNRSRAILLKNRNVFLAEVCYIINLYILCRLALGLFGMDLYEIYWWFAAGITIAVAKMAEISLKDEQASVIPQRSRHLSNSL